MYTHILKMHKVPSITLQFKISPENCDVLILNWRQYNNKLTSHILVLFVKFNEVDGEKKKDGNI